MDYRTEKNEPISPDPDWLISKQTDVLFYQGTDSLLGSLLAGVTIAVLSLFYLSDNHTQFWIWFAIYLSIIITRLLLIVSYKRRKNTSNYYVKWKQCFNIITSLSGLSWPVLLIFVIPENDVLFASFIIVCISALVSASVAIYSINLWTFTCYSFFSLVIVCLYFILIIDNFNLNVLGILGFVYLGVLYVVAWRLNKIVNRSFEEQLVNLKLIEVLTKEKQQIEKLTEKLITLSTQDGLTSIPNRRFFDEFLTKEWSRSLRFKTPLSLIICDLDFFKNYNDNYGHQKGDQTLCEIAHLLEEFSRRGGDMAARYGGEEFAIILPSTNLNNAEHVAEQIRIAISDLKIPHETSEIADHITCSFGVASVVPDRDKEKEKLIEAADKALYEAKKEGRNRTKLSYTHL